MRPQHIPVLVSVLSATQLPANMNTWHKILTVGSKLTVVGLALSGSVSPVVSALLYGIADLCSDMLKPSVPVSDDTKNS